MNAWPQIKALLDKTGISARKLAEIAGVVPSAVTKWKSGSSIRNDALNRISVHFGVSTDWLLTGNESPTHPTPAMLPPDSTTDPACRYPPGFDVCTEISQVKERLTAMEYQLDTIVRLLGASLRVGEADPGASKAG